MTNTPTLAEGERLSRAEFERRFDADPDLKMAELLDGVVRLRNDGRWLPAVGRADLMGMFGSYRVHTPSVEAGAHCSVRLDDENEPQPDVCLLVRRRFGGQTVIDSDGVVASAPELVADVVMPGQEHLIPLRSQVYRRFGTREYLVWKIADEAVDWWILRNGQFQPLAPDPADGLLKSETFPGLWLDPAALVRRDLAAVLAALTRGVRSPAHAAFVQHLAARRTP
jgi:Uma2 family endonuclease